MKKDNPLITTIDAYILIQAPEKQMGLQKIRAIIKKVAPKATEGISYQMPVFKQNGDLVYFAAFKNHFGFYPTAKPIQVFKAQIEAKGYTYSKGAIQFPCDQPFPTKLIQEIVKYRIKENQLKAESKSK